MNKYLTLEELFNFCVKNKMHSYSSSESGKPIVVTVPALFEADTNEEINGLYKVRLKACHTKLNRNNSYITKEAMEEALPSFYNKPILAHIIETSDGEYDFDKHNMEIIDDPFNEGEKRINYIEKPIGVVPESGNAHLEYDDVEDKDYVVVDGYIFTEYSNGGYEIIQQKGGTKVSVELSVDEMHYNAKENCLYIDKFTFSGVTCLGEHVTEGMKGSNLLPFEEVDPNELIAALERVKYALTKFNIKNSKEGGNDLVKLDELLKQYSVELEEINFEINGLTDQELEEEFAKAFDGEDSGESGSETGGTETGGTSTTDTPADSDPNNDDPSSGTNPVTDPVTDPVVEPVVEPPAETPSSTEEQTPNSDDETMKRRGFVKSLHVDNNGSSVVYEISHEDLRYSLYVLLSAVEEDDEEWYFITNVYDEYFVYENWDGNKIYKQLYSRDEDNVSFVGERVELFKELLTAEEKDAIESIRANYDSLMEELGQYRLAAKEDILNCDIYSNVVDTEEYKNIKDNVDKFSVEEIQTKMDLLLAKEVKAGHFSFEQKTNKLLFGEASEEIKKKPYGTLFDN